MAGADQRTLVLITSGKRYFRRFPPLFARHGNPRASRDRQQRHCPPLAHLTFIEMCTYLTLYTGTQALVYGVLICNHPTPTYLPTYLPTLPQLLTMPVLHLQPASRCMSQTWRYNSVEYPWPVRYDAVLFTTQPIVPVPPPLPPVTSAHRCKLLQPSRIGRRERMTRPQLVRHV